MLTCTLSQAPVFSVWVWTPYNVQFAATAAGCQSKRRHANNTWMNDGHSYVCNEESSLPTIESIFERHRMAQVKTYLIVCIDTEHPFMKCWRADHF